MSTCYQLAEEHFSAIEHANGALRGLSGLLIAPPGSMGQNLDVNRDDLYALIDMVQSQIGEALAQAKPAARNER